ncbi:hypothetical protein [Branchiibius sp. NY16-3462-2]|uniref:hypothetical protein n=1 Tax=Branchiibius sp. NY16-3462-2 TaxID=1807500 RepID=UPI000795E5E7|nr:hypothetical protein [Branchiibius sp. NY16-3462-2]KYH43679.1 hypothetical protein AZH51_02390 [Branchiibius sp. NY16-3462-2]
MSATAWDVAAFTGGDVSSAGWTAKAEATIAIVEQMVRAYTRGQGFDETGDANDALTAVIVSSTARLMANPEGTKTQTAGTFSVSYGTFNGWTLPELAILNQYRRRAA